MINLENINKHYFNNSGNVKQQVLADISLSIKEGDSIAIVGPSGCGKSTLLNIMGTIDRPTSGKVIFDEKEVSELNDKVLSGFRNKHIGFVFQMHHLLPQLNVFENVILPTLANSSHQDKKAASDYALKLLEQLGLKDKYYQFPGQLSGGECQRVAVARALINKPKLILADEPTGSLDQKSAEQIGELLVEIQKKQNIALVVVTHSNDLADKMQRKFSLIDGKLEEIK